MKDGKLHGKMIEYYESGKIRKEGTYDNGHKDGQWVVCYADGGIEYKGEYKNGKKHGKWVGYFASGELRYEGCFENDKSVGRWVEYYRDGKVKEEINYKNGLFDGKWTYVDENGQLRGEGTFAMGSGKWIEFDPTGKRLRRDSIETERISRPYLRRRVLQKNRMKALAGESTTAFKRWSKQSDPLRV